MYVLAPNQQVEKYPYSIGQLRKDNSQVSFPRNPSDELLTLYNMFPVATSAQPSFDKLTHRLQEVTPELQNGVWWQVWTVVELTNEERQQVLHQIKEAVTEQTQQRLDDFARTRNYDSILSLCTYVSSANPKFQQEGLYGVEARDTTWAKLHEILAEVESGARPIPSGYFEIEPELPPLTWKE
jgi:hypothetical protein